ncbi:MAG: hypothetical protein BWX73_00080 [Lentisphaerae bacterium ADurb.Bin082]|nr:MAG: hypothetical protein BWX73_00080 [Lentisphaerae bacterium ADurb.Bin082]
MTKLRRLLAIAVLFAFAPFCLASPLPADAIVFEAEDMRVDGSGAWQAKPHYPNWYASKPSKLHFLAGSYPGLGQAEQTLRLPEAGTFRLHVRYLDIIRFDHRSFQVAVSQDGRVLAEKIFDQESLRQTPEGEQRWGKGFGRFVWDNLEFTAAAGDVTVTLSKTSAEVSTGHVRQLDVFVLTRDLAYEPAVTDLYPLYVQVVMLPEQPGPVALHLFMRRSHAPYYSHANINAQGLFLGSTHGADDMPDAHLKRGQSSPWVNLSPLLTYSGSDRMSFSAITTYRGKPEPEAAFELIFSRTPDLTGLIGRPVRKGAGSGMIVAFNNTTGELVPEEDGSRQNLERARNTPEVAGARPRTFPMLTGMALTPEVSMAASWERELEALATIGLNGVGQVRPPFVDRGFTRNIASGFYFHLTRPDCKYVVDEQKLAEHMAKHRADIDFSHVLAFNMMDEPGFELEHLLNCAVCQRDFTAFLEAQQITAAFPLTDDPQAGSAFYWTMRFLIHRMTEKLRAGTLAARAAGITVPTMVNFAIEVVYSGNLVRRGADWFDVYNSGALTFGWHEDWASHSRTYQIIGYQSDVMRAACRRSGIPFGVYNVLQVHPWEIQAKAYTEIGHGNQAIHFFNYGPAYSISSDTNSDRPEIYAAIKQVAWPVGAVENHLTAAKTAPADAAQLLSVTNDIWNAKDDNVFGKERVYLNLLLRHVNVRLDVLSEDDLATELARYRTLFVSDAVVKRTAAMQILEWVKQGGTLYMTAGALEYDERRQPLDLDRDLGVSRKPFTLEEQPGRAQFEMPKLKELASVQSVPVVAGQQPPFLQRSTVGAGTVVSLGFFPGLSYVSRAGSETERPDGSIYSEVDFPAAHRALAATWAKGRLRTDHHLIEANVLTAPGADVIVLANWSGTPMTTTVTLDQAHRYAEIKAVNAEIISQTQADGALAVTLRLAAGAFLECRR